MTETQRCILGVFAHPDDETSCAGGTMARYAQEGVEVQVVTATRGEQGTLGTGDYEVTRADLPGVREAELRAVLQMYGAKPPRFLGYYDGAVAQVDREELITTIHAIMQESQPQVVITFGPMGISGHEDHKAIHRATVAAFQRYGQTTATVPRLFYAALHPDVVSQLRLTLEGPEVQPTLLIDTADYRALKIRGWRMYRTQEDAQRLADMFEHTPITAEAFHQAYPPVPPGVLTSGFWTSQ